MGAFVSPPWGRHSSGTRPPMPRSDDNKKHSPSDGDDFRPLIKACLSITIQCLHRGVSISKFECETSPALTEKSSSLADKRKYLTMQGMSPTLNLAESHRKEREELEILSNSKMRSRK